MAGLDDDTMDGIADLRQRRMMRTSPILEEAWRYWNSLRDGTALPRRDALDPKAMSLILGNSMVLDRVRPGTVRVRLGGRTMHDLMGMNVRGLPARAFFDLDTRARAVGLIEEVFETPATLEMMLVSEGRDGPLNGKMLVLPLLDADGNCTKALTCMTLDRHVGQAPRRFRLDRHVATPIAHAQTRPVPRRRVTDYLPLEAAETQAPFEAAKQVVPWLRVVK